MLPPISEGLGKCLERVSRCAVHLTELAFWRESNDPIIKWYQSRTRVCLVGGSFGRGPSMMRASQIGGISCHFPHQRDLEKNLGIYVCARPIKLGFWKEINVSATLS